MKDYKDNPYSFEKHTDESITIKPETCIKTDSEQDRLGFLMDLY